MTRFRRAAHTEFFWAVDRLDRLRLCAELVNAADRAVIFCRSAPDAIRVASELSRIGIPAASVEHRDFSSSRVRARVVTDDTATQCGRASTGCVIQFDPAVTLRRYRRRLDLVANEHAMVVSLVVPEREPETLRLLHALDTTDGLSAPDVAAVAEALAAAPVALAPVPEHDGHASTDAAPMHKVALTAALGIVRQVPHHASRAGQAVGRRVRDQLRRNDRP